MSRFVLTQRTVHVLIADVGARSGLIADIRADEVAPTDNAAGLNAQLAALVDFNLYEAGHRALTAVRQLDLRRSRMSAVLKPEARRLPGYLSVPNGMTLSGLDTGNARSAELGLALTLLAYGGQAPSATIFATGQLALPSAANLGAAAVEPVGELELKFAAMRDHLLASSLQKTPVHLIVPEETSSGTLTEQEHAVAIAAIARVCRDQGRAFNLTPVSTLAQAARVIGVAGLVPTATERLLTATAAAAMAGCVFWSAHAVWQSRAIALSFGDIVLADGAHVTSPIRAAFDTARAAYVVRQACLGEQSTPVFKETDSLILRVKAPPPARPTEWLGGYHHVLVAISEKSEPVVLAPESIARALAKSPDAVEVAATSATPAEISWGFSVALPLKPPAEITRLIVLVQRGRPFDVGTLRHDLDQAVAGRPIDGRINAAVSRLIGRAPGYLDYTFRTTEGDLPCEPKP